jgi:hypothetical protein
MRKDLLLLLLAVALLAALAPSPASALPASPALAGLVKADPMVLPARNLCGGGWHRAPRSKWRRHR